MKDLCARGRAVMNLLLLILLLQIWALIPSDASSERIEEDLRAIGAALPDVDDETYTKFSYKFYEREARKTLSDTPTQDVWSLSAVVLAIGLHQTMTENRPAGDPETAKRIRAATDALAHLKDLIKASGVTIASSNFTELESKLSEEIEAPFVKVKISPKKAAGLLAIAVVPPLVVLLAIIDSLWLLLPPEEAELDFLDLIVFYPSKVSYFVSVIWLTLPVGLAWWLSPSLRELHGAAQLGEVLAFLFAASVAVWIHFRIFHIRRIISARQVGAEEAVGDVKVSAKQESDEDEDDGEEGSGI
jgi:hypothetical protein